MEPASLSAVCFVAEDLLHGMCNAQEFRATLESLHQVLAVIASQQPPSSSLAASAPDGIARPRITAVLRQRARCMHCSKTCHPVWG